jgi:threonine/homoserine/homoserine lactone efflux protein
MHIELGFLLKGLLIGIITTIPVGPAGLLVVNRTLNNGRVSGLLTGLGIAAADVVFAILAGLGVTIMVQFVEEGKLYFNLAGSLVIISLGMLIFFRNPIKQLRNNKPHEKRNTWYLLSGMFLTLSNPVVLLVYLALFTALNINNSTAHLSIFTLIGGMLIGAIFGWLLVSTIFNHIRSSIRLRKIFWLNKIAGAAIFTIGALTILGLFFTI